MEITGERVEGGHGIGVARPAQTDAALDERVTLEMIPDAAPCPSVPTLSFALLQDPLDAALADDDPPTVVQNANDFGVVIGAFAVALPFPVPNAAISPPPASRYRRG